MLRSREISEGWRLCCQAWLEPPGYLAFGQYQWLPATVPGHVHHDLEASGVIGDPFFALQELGCQWIDEQAWIYETTFNCAQEATHLYRVLRFEGLDTVCIVHLNGGLIASHVNMFTPLEVEVGERLRSSANELRITFLPAIAEARKRRSEYFAAEGLRPDLVRFESRAFVRKAPYMFGWDWGPQLVSAGVWKPVRLIEFSARIEHVDVRQFHERDGRVRLRCDTQIAGDGRLVHVWNGPEQDSIIFSDAAEITLSAPQLWWPHGLGEQRLYTLTSYLLPDSNGTNSQLVEYASSEQLAQLALDVRRQRIGLRTVALIREADEWGESFRFEINGTRLWCVGANWIPDHSFPSQVTRARLAQQLDRVVDMHMNMLRVWGGGVYESDDFYDLCDERGILVWQDFPFACSYSPDDEASVAVIEAEAELNVRRLRHHPSLVLWCGNNENRMMFEAKWDDEQRHPSRCIGERIWDDALPNLLARLDPDRPYIATSPHSSRLGVPVNSDECGDQHNWDVWHGRGDWGHYNASKARFASEYGFASSPTGEAWMRMAGSDWEGLDVAHPIARWHDKTKKGYDTFRRLVELHYPRASSVDEWAYLSQLNQRDALRAAVDHYRRSAFCAGSLIWQLNDCWPVQSWSVLDSTGAYKAAAYELRRLYAPLAVSLERQAGVGSEAGRVWAVLHNASSARDVIITLQVCDSRDGGVLHGSQCAAHIEPNQALMVMDVDLRPYEPTTTVIGVMYDGMSFWTPLCEPKALIAAPGQFEAHRRGDEIHITSRTPAFDVFIRPDNEAHLSHNFFNFPTAGTLSVGVKGNCAALAIRWLGGNTEVPVTTENNQATATITN